MNTIHLDSKGIGTFYGANAQPFSYNKELREGIDRLYSATFASTNRFFVIANDNGRMAVYAAQSTRDGALGYMKDGRILVETSEPPYSLSTEGILS